jgi:hypothetical protein
LSNHPSQDLTNLPAIPERDLLPKLVQRKLLLRAPFLAGAPLSS